MCIRDSVQCRLFATWGTSVNIGVGNNTKPTSQAGSRDPSHVCCNTVYAEMQTLADAYFFLADSVRRPSQVHLPTGNRTRMFEYDDYRKCLDSVFIVLTSPPVSDGSRRIAIMS